MVALINFGQFGKVRRARKAYTCDTSFGWPDPKPCLQPINPGDYYIEGDSNIDRAGGFGNDRHCLECAERVWPAKAEVVTDFIRDERNDLQPDRSRLDLNVARA